MCDLRRYYYLFDDLFLWTRKSGTSIKLEATVPLSEAIVRDLTPPRPDGIKIFYIIIIIVFLILLILLIVKIVNFNIFLFPLQNLALIWCMQHRKHMHLFLKWKMIPSENNCKL